MRSWKVAALVLLGVALVAIGGTVITLRAQQGPNRVVVAPNVQVLLQEGPQIGVTIREVTQDDVAKLKLPSQEGAVVDGVNKDSPAEKAGIKAGDVIVEFDGQKVRGVRQLTRVVRETPGGRPAKVAVMRDGRRVELNVAPEERSLVDSLAGANLGAMRDLQGRLRDLGKDFSVERYFRAEPGPRGQQWFYSSPLDPSLGPVLPRSPGRLGVAVEDLTEQLASYFGAKDGVLVRSVNDNSPAAKAGVKAGDVITSFNSEAVTSASGFSRMARNAKDGEEVTLGILRDHKSITLKVKPEGAPPRRRPLTPVVPA